jgi:hypothetical protein
MQTKFYSEILMGRDHIGHVGLGARLMLNWILKNGCKGVNWIFLIHNWVLWWIVVNMILNLWVP